MSGKRVCVTCKLKGRLLVRVRHEVSRAGLPGNSVTITGPTPGAKPTNTPGIAEFEARDPGSYDVDVALSAVNIARHYKILPYGKTVGVSRGMQTTLDVFVRPLSTLRVKVIARWPAKRGVVKEEVLKGVKFTAKGPQDLKDESAADGMHTFEGIESGTYKAAATTMIGLEDKYMLPRPASIDLPPGATKEVLLIADVLASLRFVVFGDDGKPVSGARWTLDSPVTGQGTTGANGLIEVRVVPLARGNGVLKVQLPKPPAVPKAPASPVAVVPAPDIPPYPPAIKMDDFTDVVPASETPGGEVVWALNIALLDDHADDNGVKGRLDNMGFKCVGLPAGPALVRTIKAYQRVHMQQAAGSGLLADVKAHVIDLHDTP